MILGQSIKVTPKQNIDGYKIAKSAVFEFENNIYVVNDEIAGRLVDGVVIDKDFISLTTQKLFTTLPKLDTKYVTAYDCLLFLHDPNKRPDNLLNVI